MTFYSANIIVGGTPSADSVASGWTIENACDGSLATMWVSTNSNYPHWWKYDLGVGKEKAVEKLRWSTGTPNWQGSAIKDFVLQGSNNDSDWIDVFTAQGINTAAGTWQEWTFENPRLFRYYRLYITSDWNDAYNFCELEEIEMMINIDRVLSGYLKSRSHDRLDMSPVSGG